MKKLLLTVGCLVAGVTMAQTIRPAQLAPSTYADTATIPASARGAFHLPHGADRTIGGWLARFEESQIKTVRTGWGILDVASPHNPGEIPRFAQFTFLQEDVSFSITGSDDQGLSAIIRFICLGIICNAATMIKTKGANDILGRKVERDREVHPDSPAL